MKRFVLSLIALFALTFGAYSQNVNIPDANFKAYLLGYPPANPNGDNEIQVSEAAALTGGLNCSGLNISDLTGIEAFTSITGLNCYDNNLTTLNISQNVNLTSLGCSQNNLTALDVSQNTALTSLGCIYNNISALDVSQNTNLTNLSCSENNISTLDLSQNTALTQLGCTANNLSTLDLSQNLNITLLQCSSNNLTTLNLGANQAITDLYCMQNMLTSLDISQNPALTTVWCYVNDITVLDPSQNLNLTNLNCHNNNIAALDVSQNINLTSLSLYNNDMTSLNMKNISTTALTSFWAIQNPNLLCIEVDDVALATAAWTNVDPASSFNLDCSIPVTSISVQGQNGISTITVPAGTLQMEATVLPTNADDATYTWSVVDGTGSASISAGGVLTAITDGDVTVIATANDGSGVMGNTHVTITNQSLTVNEQATFPMISIYPNPVTTQLIIQSEEPITSINIIDLLGKSVRRIASPNKVVEVSDLPEGVYFIQIQIKDVLVIKKFVKA